MSALLAVSAFAALSSLPTAAAQNCYYSYGRRYCNGNGLAYGARWGIGIAVAAAFVLLLFLMLCLRKRRVRRANLQYAQHQQAEMGQSYQPPQQNGFQGAFFPHYQNPNQQGMFNKHSRNEEDVQPPPPAYNPNANGATEASQNGNQHYAPPAGPPPGQQDNSVEAREWAQHQENLRQQQQSGGH